MYWIRRQTPGQAIDPKGLNCIPVDIDQDKQAFIITFPRPERVTEAFMAAIVVPLEAGDQNHPNCRYITLEYGDAPRGTLLCEWSPVSGHKNYGDGPEPTIDLFVDAVKRLVSREEADAAPINELKWAEEDDDEPVESEVMTSAEVHEFGIEIVFEQMKKDGYEILGVNTDLEMNPQILAKKDGRLVHIAVRTACYPKKGELENEQVALQLINYADMQSATCYFASVGIANASGTTDEEMAIPVRGSGFYAAFEGLQILTTSNRVKILGKDV